MDDLLLAVLGGYIAYFLLLLAGLLIESLTPPVLRALRWLRDRPTVAQMRAVGYAKSGGYASPDQRINLSMHLETGKFGATLNPQQFILLLSGQLGGIAD